MSELEFMQKMQDAGLAVARYSQKFLLAMRLGDMTEALIAAQEAKAANLLFRQLVTDFVAAYPNNESVDAMSKVLEQIEIMDKAFEGICNKLGPPIPQVWETEKDKKPN